MSRGTRGDSLHQACVLLSGGLDSVAALHWTRPRAQALRAICFDYGQPNRDHEVAIAGRICADLGVPLVRLALADTLATGLGLLAGVTDHEAGRLGEHPAFLPGRNAVFLTVAAAHAASWWKAGTLDLVVGANADDAAGFPDCRARFFEACAGAIRVGHGREVEIRAPFLGMRKAEIAATAATTEARRDIARSWSCYRKAGPCGACTPCVLRREALATAGIVDTCAPAVMHGGDPAREQGMAR
jgi:7-cyano-7-deazaguanine synthase